MDSIAEFSVQTNAFQRRIRRRRRRGGDGDYQGGTNQFHGSLFEYRQGSDVNANSFFNNARKLKLSPYRYDQYGGTVGGPVYIPKVYNGRDKSFFFFDYERLPRRSPGSLTSANVAPPAQVQGDFSGGPTIYDPTNGSPFPGNAIPANRVDPVARKIADALPKPNTLGAQNYFVGVPNEVHEYRMAIRGDQKLSGKDQIVRTLPGLEAKHAQPQRVHRNDPLHRQQHRAGGLRLGLQRNPYVHAEPGKRGALRPHGGRQHEPARAGGPGHQFADRAEGDPDPGQRAHRRLTGVTFSNSLSALGGASPSRSYSAVNQFSDMATWNHGRHLVKVGYEYRRIQFLSFSGGFRRSASSSSTGTILREPGRRDSRSRTFLLGLPGRVRFGNLITNDYRRRSHAAFVQDHFTVSPRLTVNFGVRWEYLTPVWEDGERGSALNVFTRTLQFPGYQGPIPAALQRQVDKGIIKLDRNATKYFNSPPHKRNFGPARRLRLPAGREDRAARRIRHLLRRRRHRTVGAAQRGIQRAQPGGIQLQPCRLAAHHPESGELQDRNSGRRADQSHGHHHLRARSFAAYALLPALERDAAARVPAQLSPWSCLTSGRRRPTSTGSRITIFPP